MVEKAISTLKCPAGEVLLKPNFPDSKPFCYKKDADESFSPGGFGSNIRPCTRPKKQPQFENDILYCHFNTSVAFMCPSSDRVQNETIDAFFPYDAENSTAIDEKVYAILLQKQMQYAWSLLLRGCLGREPLKPGRDDAESMTVEFSTFGAPIGFVRESDQPSNNLASDPVCRGECSVLADSNESCPTFDRTITLKKQKISIFAPKLSEPKWPDERLHIVRSADGRKLDQENNDEEAKQKSVNVYNIKIEQAGVIQELNLEMNPDEKPNLFVVDLDKDGYPEMINRRNVIGPDGPGSYYYVLHSKTELERLQKAFVKRVSQTYKADASKKTLPHSGESTLTSQNICP